MMTEQCSSCILPVNLPGMDPDRNGKCSYCRKSEEDRKAEDTEQLETKEKFEEIVERFRGRSKYDCLVPLSGGKESSYIIYTLVKDYNLKVLAVNLDNGFRHSDAVANMERLVNAINADLIVYKPGRDTMLRLFHRFLSKAGEFCTPCNMLINTTVMRFARDNSIRLIMSGNTVRTGPGMEGVSPALYYDRAYYLNIAGDILSRRERPYYIARPYVVAGIQRLLGTVPRVINVLDYLKPTLREIETSLQSIGWTRPAGVIQHGDCLLDPLKDYLMYRKWGCTEVTALYSLLVRNGEMGREGALSRALAEEHRETPKILPEFLDNMGMTQEEFDEALTRDFRDIPNLRSSAFFQCARKFVQSAERLMGRR